MSRGHKAIASALAVVVFLTAGAPLAAKAQEARDSRPSTPSYNLPAGAGDITDYLPSDFAEAEGESVARDYIDPDATSFGANGEPIPHAELDPEAIAELERAADLPETPTDLPDGASTAALPTGEAKSAVTPSRISIPNAEGSIEGMGESFAPVLSSGTATFSVPIALPAGRAGVQPSLGLSYASTGGNSAVGIGWNLSTPMILRQSDRGLPRYIDDEQWHVEEDRFFYNGGQELVPVDNTAASIVDASHNAMGPRYQDTHFVPADAPDWQQYRARVEGGFMRFFRSPDSDRWIVQGKDGTRFDFGLVETHPADLDPTQALQVDPADPSRIYAWRLTRMSDPHGSTVYYRYLQDAGEIYPADIFYLSPNDCSATGIDCTEPLSNFGVRVHFDYETRPDVTSRYTAGHRIETGLRLQRVVVTAADQANTGRYLVRRYHLTYAANSYHSLLESVQVEGRPAETQFAGTLFEHEAFSNVSESAALGTGDVGQRLPAMTFTYTEPPSLTTGVAGFGSVDPTVHTVGDSPDVSFDAARADFFDVNTDGLPDLIVTDPARYRTDDGEPAVGVFFNGFSGPNATPAGVAGTFSAPIAVPMPAYLSGTLNLGSQNILPMDVDGDGRSDLMHLPRRDRYGYFVVTRSSDDAAGYSASPADQGWRFTYAQVETGGADPRVDLVRDGSRYRTWDVNGDHLIDISRTTGTVMQTWLNLGFVRDAETGEGAEGRFGRATANEDGTFTIDTEPHETCLLHDGLPVDFSDPELRTADMNGDGLVDIVKIRRGHVVYWPGRGVTETGAPVFGDGPRDCRRGDGDDRERVMATPPAELNPELSGVILADVNMDGASDVLQVRFRELDVWFNRAGEGFTERVTVDSPMAPDFAPRIRMADIDGSGTTDLVYGSASRWEYLDLMGGQRPRLLREVRNGLGAVTNLAYGSSAEDYTGDLEEADTCSDCEAFTWSRVSGDCDARLEELSGECAYRSGGSPVISTVVRSVTTTDQFDLLGREENVSVTQFAYHDGYYEGIEQEFRGFGAADAVAVGDANHPTAITRTWFHQGRRPTSIATDRLAENPFEALKGRQWLSETFDEAGTFLSSAHATITMRRLMTGLDGRDVAYAFVSQSNELRYATDFPSASPGELALDWLVTEHVDDAGALIPDDTCPGSVTIRNGTYVNIQSTTDEVDNLGQVLHQIAHGRVADTEGYFAAGTEQIESFAVPELVNPASWIWRTGETWIEGHGASGRLGYAHNTFDTTTGDLLHAEQHADLSGVTLDFAGDADGAAAYTLAQAYPSDTQVLEASTAYDAWGNPTASCAGGDLGESGTNTADCLRYAEVDYDGAFAQLPVTEAIALNQSSATWCDRTTGSFCMLETTAAWDRGLGVLLSATDPNADTTTVTYDGLGRLTGVEPPDAPNEDDSCAVGRPVTTFQYDLNVEGLPVSRVSSTAMFKCNVSYQHSHSYVDGLGRARATLARSSKNTTGVRHWQQSGIGVFSARGTAVRAFNGQWIKSDEPHPVDAVGLDATLPDTLARHDAFGRVTRATAQDDSFSTMRYGALMTEACDPLDLGEHGTSAVPFAPGTFTGTCALSYVDGHGRGVDQILHNRIPDGVGMGIDEFYRLWTTYRADGSVLSVTRAQTATGTVVDRTAVNGSDGQPHTLTRTFVYDSLGRRISGTDPDSDGRTGPESGRRWRYLYNDVGDLAAVRDPRGCGANFYYDYAGRLLGEDYVTCDEAQHAFENPYDQTLPGSGAIGLGVVSSPETQTVDALYHFDEAPGYATGAMAPPTGTNYLGRLTGTSDRGQRSVVDYDDRGRPFWSARQMVLLPDAPTIPATLSGNDPVLYDEGDLTTVIDREWDQEHTYVTTTLYDRLDRPVDLTYPEDPDWAGGGSAPVVRGTMSYTFRGSPLRARLEIDAFSQEIQELHYDAQNRHFRTYFGGFGAGAGSYQVFTQTTYDDRHRPTILRHFRAGAVRSGVAPGDLSAFIEPNDFRYFWDAANNLVEVNNGSNTTHSSVDKEVRRFDIEHDALYRVSMIQYEYQDPTGGWDPFAQATDWRTTQAAQVSGDPMQRVPAPMLPQMAPERVKQLEYRHDWLANQVSWIDDTLGVDGEGTSFYERSIGQEGQLVNGADEDIANLRPAALYFSAQLPDSAPAYDAGADRGGWLDLEYGASGNVEEMTVRARCHDVDATDVCYDDTSLSLANREAHLLAHCRCDREQHYQYRWDELNRMAEARRYDRTNGTGDWTLATRQRYRYDAGNVRTVKLTSSGGVDRASLYVLPGDMERRGVVVDRDILNGDAWRPAPGVNAETQYLVGGARVVWKTTPDAMAGGGANFETDVRITVPLQDLLQTTVATMDLVSGELLEVGTFYPSGNRETLRARDSSVDGQTFQLEPMGFTGKEGDDDVGVVYFGERYLLPHVGRWASADPLQVHAGGGGEFGNSYHYVSGNLLEARDPIGLAPDRPGLEISPAARAVLESYRVRPFVRASPTGVREAYSILDSTLLDFIRAAPNIRPREVEQAARSGTLQRNRRALGVFGEFFAARAILRQTTSNVGGLFAVTPHRHLGFQPATYAGMSFDLAIGVPGSCGVCPAPLDWAESKLQGVLTSDDRRRGRITPSPHGYDLGNRQYTLHVEVTISRTPRHIIDRATSVGVHQRTLSTRDTDSHKHLAILAIDRAVWFRIMDNSERMEALRNATHSGGMIMLVRDLRHDAHQFARDYQNLLQTGTPVSAPSQSTQAEDGSSDE